MYSIYVQVRSNSTVIDSGPRHKKSFIAFISHYVRYFMILGSSWKVGVADVNVEHKYLTIYRITYVKK